jgi:hypothetical protein
VATCGDANGLDLGQIGPPTRRLGPNAAKIREKIEYAEGRAGFQTIPPGVQNSGKSA